MTKPSIQRCLKPAPDVLTGSLGPLRCQKETSKHGWHQGDHKVSVTVPGLGKTVVTWRQGPEYQPRPEVRLGRTGGALKGGLVVRLCNGGCPPTAKADQHLPGCALRR